MLPLLLDWLSAAPDPDLAALYDLDNGWGADLDYCLALGREAGSVLDLGCGTGRLIAALARDSSSNGSVGMWGISWGGFNAIQVAMRQPPALKAILALHAGGTTLPAFMLASLLARLPRFLIVSVGTALIGRALSRWLSERQLLWLLIGAWLLFYAVFFALMPN